MRSDCLNFLSAAILEAKLHVYLYNLDNNNTVQYGKNKRQKVIFSASCNKQVFCPKP